MLVLVSTTRCNSSGHSFRSRPQLYLLSSAAVMEQDPRSKSKHQRASVSSPCWHHGKLARVSLLQSSLNLWTPSYRRVPGIALLLGHAIFSVFDDLISPLSQSSGPQL
ncbi:unnamed protein product [Linum trigynum]|uniref:Uncharacterized protein n=1 Tax=Linum trigynum TaxID=586398 RepID=A0AAV2G1Y0_9ROSI